ncbi:MAG TPA: hypothetical protein PJ997_02295 [Candidatus Paceibacterota bacterium]|nr:hypothetical protein [Candidatus Paceibacterota bacterium]HMP19144.1 hypothetical protein [Candidatus Paceibacterota bacterium]HMP85147.1 hypothetical protein [Candidatus Paceibacterota bacterium]
MTIEFEEDNSINIPQFDNYKKKGFDIVDFLVNKRIFRNQKNAEIFLISICLVIILVSFYVTYSIFGDGRVDNRSYSELTPAEKMKFSPEHRELLESIEEANRLRGN